MSVPAPSDYRTAGLLMMISGGVHLAVSALLFLTACVWTVALYGCGFPCVFLVLPVPLLALRELTTGARMQQGTHVPNAIGVSRLGIALAMYTCVAGTCTLLAPVGMIPLVLEAVAYGMLARPDVAGWIEAGEE